MLAEKWEAPMKEMDWLPEHGKIKWWHQAHLIAINDVRLSIGIDAADCGFELSTWFTERELKRSKIETFLPGAKGRMRKVTLVPDAFFSLFVPGADDTGFTYPNLVEVDRSTEHIGMHSDKEYLNHFKTKIPRYLSFYRSGGYTEYFRYDEMRVLFITTDESRLQKMKAVTEALGGGRRFWFTTLEEITKPKTALTQPIWHIAGQEGKEPLVF